MDACFDRYELETVRVGYLATLVNQVSKLDFNLKIDIWRYINFS